MKNPFIKKDHTILITAIALGVIVAGSVTYLYLTESGETLRDNLKDKAKNKAQDIAAGFISRKTGISKKHLVKAAKVFSKKIS